jgi:hypothetical protein
VPGAGPIILTGLFTFSKFKKTLCSIGLGERRKDEEQPQLVCLGDISQLQLREGRASAFKAQDER